MEKLKKRLTPQDRWLALTAEERAALDEQQRQEMLAKLHDFLKKREARNRVKKLRRYLKAEEEAWAEYADRERKAKLARAVAKIRRRNG